MELGLGTIERTHLAALSLAIGGLSGFLVETLYLSALNQTDGSVFGVSWDYYAAWLIFPVLFVLFGCRGLHRLQETRYGRLGRIGFAVTVGGYSMIAFGLIWSEVLLPPDHPLEFFGDRASGLGLLVVSAGWAVWGVASVKARSLPGWAVAVPFVIAFVWVGFRFPLHDFFADAHWAGEAPFRYAVHALGLCVLAAALWQNNVESMPTAPEPALDRI